MLADNKLTDRSSWDDAALAVHLKELSELVLDFDIEDIGFELPEIDFRIQSLDAVEDADLADEFQLFPGFAVSRPGDLWLLGYHRLYCGSALETTAYDVLLDGAKAATAFTDPPYNVKIDGHACGSGAIKHREFAMASGEMTSQTFERFLAEANGRRVSQGRLRVVGCGAFGLGFDGGLGGEAENMSLFAPVVRQVLAQSQESGRRELDRLTALKQRAHNIRRQMGQSNEGG